MVAKFGRLSLFWNYPAPFISKASHLDQAGLILGLRPANGRRRYFVTSLCNLKVHFCVISENWDVASHWKPGRRSVYSPLFTCNTMTAVDLEMQGARASGVIGGWFNKKIPSYQYRKSHCGDQTILRPSYLHNGISYTGKMTSLYWISVEWILQWYQGYCTWRVNVKNDLTLTHISVTLFSW